MKQKNNYFVITGAPGVGKTSLIHLFRKRNILCIDEPARKILAEQRASGGSGLPEIDSSLFTELLLSHSIQSYEDHQREQEPIIFDRSIVDCIAYATWFGIDTLPFEQAAQKYQYNKMVFLLSPRQDIYRTDEERKMTFEDTVRFHELIINAYKKMNYQILEVPHSTLEDCADFVHDAYKALTTTPVS